jgi:hypothetical protein
MKKTPFNFKRCSKLLIYYYFTNYLTEGLGYIDFVRNNLHFLKAGRLTQKSKENEYSKNIDRPSDGEFCILDTILIVAELIHHKSMGTCDLALIIAIASIIAVIPAIRWLAPTSGGGFV